MSLLQIVPASFPQPDSTPTVPSTQFVSSLSTLFFSCLEPSDHGFPHDSLISLFHAGSASGGLSNANFAHFDNFPKSSSADFGSFSSSSQSNSTGAGSDAVQSTSVSVDRYAVLADLDNVFSSAKTEQGKHFGLACFIDLSFRAKGSVKEKKQRYKVIRHIDLGPFEF